MANSINESLDILRRSVLSVIINNTDIKFTSIKQSLEEYIASGDSLFSSLLHLMDFNPQMLDSSQMSAVYLLSYMDFFAVYALMYSNYMPVFQNLKHISESKYAHIYNLYKDLSSVMKEKQAAQKYFFIRYNSFLFPKNINTEGSGLINRIEKASKPLGFNGVCTLPLRKQTEVKPSSITYFSGDGAVSTNASSVKQDGFSFEILRSQSNKIGTVTGSGVKPASSTTISIPDVAGTIFGYFSESIHLELVDIVRGNANGIISVSLIGSTNGFDWSDVFVANVDSQTSLLIEDNIAIGLNVNFYSGMNLRVGNKWLISISNIDVKYPSLMLDVNFDILEPVSFIRYMDISSYKLGVNSSTIDRNRFSSERISPYTYDGRIGHVTVCEGGLNQLKTELSQYDYDIQSDNGSLYYKYDFKLSDITAYINEYERHGSLAFDPLVVDGINTVTVDSKCRMPEYKPNRIDYSESKEDQATKVSIPKSSLEFNIIAETDTSRAVIPMLPTDILTDRTTYTENSMSLLNSLHLDANDGDYGTVRGIDELYVRIGSSWIKYTEDQSADTPLIFEHVIPDSVDYNESYGNIEYAPAIYKPRFPVNEDYNIKNTDPVLTFNSEKMVEAGSNYIINTKSVTISEYFMKDTHSIFYGVDISNIADMIGSAVGEKWIQAASNIYYIYYMDENRKVHLAIRNIDASTGGLIPFVGSITGQIEMSSIDESYKTPMVFDYTLGII